MYKAARLSIEYYIIPKIKQKNLQKMQEYLEMFPKVSN